MQRRRTSADSVASRWLTAASVIACALFSFSYAPQLPAADAVPDAAAVAQLIDTLGVPVARESVRARPGWHPPRIILVAPALHDLLPQLQPLAPKAKFIEMPNATARDVAGADVAIGVCSEVLLGQAKGLGWIQWLAAGVERCVQQPLLRERNPLLTNMQRTAAPSMAEHVLGMMLALSRHFSYFIKEQQAAHWAENTPRLEDLDGKTVLVVGLGGIGTEVAKRTHALGMRVIATRASGRSGPDYVSYVGLPDELLKLTKDADFVVNCTPLTPQTRGIFNREFFAAMKPTAYFIAVGRGGSTVTPDLITALTTHRIAGAGLDVVDPEPLPAESGLWRAPNVIITPHVSADTQVSEEQRTILLRENLRRYVAGEPMLAVVDIERGY